MASVNFDDYVGMYLTAVVKGSIEEYADFFSNDIKFCMYPVEENNSLMVTISGTGKDSLIIDLFDFWFRAKEEKCEQDLLDFTCVEYQTTETEKGTVLLIKWQCWVKKEDDTPVIYNFEDKLLLNENNLIIEAEFEGENEGFFSELEW
jgi:hypothetical protein